MDTAFRADIIVEDALILELKATEIDNPLYARQLLTYLKLSGKEIGLVLNFNKLMLKEGIKRLVLG